MSNRIKSHVVEIPKKTIQCNFFVDEALAGLIAKEAGDRGRKFNTVARELLEEHLGVRQSQTAPLDLSDLEPWLKSVVEELKKIDSKNRGPIEAIIRQCLKIQGEGTKEGVRATSAGVTYHPEKPGKDRMRR